MSLVYWVDLDLINREAIFHGELSIDREKARIHLNEYEVRLCLEFSFLKKPNAKGKLIEEKYPNETRNL